MRGADSKFGVGQPVCLGVHGAGTGGFLPSACVQQLCLPSCTCHYMFAVDLQTNKVHCLQPCSDAALANPCLLLLQLCALVCQALVLLTVTSHAAVLTHQQARCAQEYATQVGVVTSCITAQGIMQVALDAVSSRLPGPGQTLLPLRVCAAH